MDLVSFKYPLRVASGECEGPGAGPEEDLRHAEPAQAAPLEEAAGDIRHLRLCLLVRRPQL